MLTVEPLEDRLTPATQTFTPNTFADVPYVLDTTLSLREAVIAANDAAYFQGDDAIVQLSAGTYALSILGRDEDSGFTGDLDLQTFGRTITIQGAGAGVTVINAGQIDRVFQILSANSKVILKNLTITGGKGITPASALSTAKVGGGGILNNGGTLTLDGVNVTGNSYVGIAETTTGGGGIATFGGTVTIQNSTISSNAVSVSGFGRSYNLTGADGGEDENGQNGKVGPTAGLVAGGGLFVNGGFVTVSNSTFNKNSLTGGTGLSGGTGGDGGEGSTGSGGTGGQGGNGGAGSAAYGSAIYAALVGRLTVTNSVLTENAATGGQGGDGGTGGGGDGYSGDGIGGAAGPGGAASGAIYTSMVGSAIAGVQISNNKAVGGKGGEGGYGRYGGSGGTGGAAMGGAISVLASASVSKATLENNSVLGGTGGLGGTQANSVRADEPTAGTGGTGGAAMGGGLYVDNPNATFVDIYSHSNKATGGIGGNGGSGGHGDEGEADFPLGNAGYRGGVGGWGGTGGSAYGGGGYAKNVGFINRSTFDANQLVGGAPGDGGVGGNGGEGGAGLVYGDDGDGGPGGNGGKAGVTRGGGLYVQTTQVAKLANSTFGFNTISTPTFTSKGGRGGFGDSAGSNGAGYTSKTTDEGGGIYATGGLIASNLTVANNSTGIAGGGVGVSLRNTIVAFNGTADLTGTYLSGGSNIVRIGSTSNFSAGDTASNKIGTAGSPVDPGIDTVLANNGGATPTFQLLPGSIAIDAGTDTATQTPLFLTTDQRGVARLSGAHVDIGAFERQSDVSLIGEFTSGEEVPLFSELELKLTVFVGQDAGSPNVTLEYRFDGPYSMYTPTPPSGWTWDWIRDSSDNSIIGITASKTSVAPGSYVFTLGHSIDVGATVGTITDHRAAITHTFAGDTNPNNEVVDLQSTIVNPVPGLVRLDQLTAAEGSSPTFDLVAMYVVPGAKVYWDGVEVPTTYVNAGRLRISVPPTLTTDNGEVQITVENPGPGGGLATGYMLFTVVNIAPTATLNINSGAWVKQGSLVGAVLTNAYDPSSADTEAGLRYSVATSLAGLATNYYAASTLPGDALLVNTPGAVTIYGRIFDKDGGFTTYTSSVVNVYASNAAPVLSGSNSFASIAEDSTPSGTLVSALVSGRVTDDGIGATGIAVIGTSSTANGTWQYSTNGTTWTNFGAVRPTSATVLRGTDRVRFVPAANYNGGASLTFRAWDQTDGRIAGTTGVNTSSNGGITPFSTSTATANITVWEVNDAPSVIDENLGGMPQGVATVIPFSTLLANDFPALEGQSPDENGQTVTISRIDSTSNCTAVIVGNTVVVTPTGTGAASFVYWAKDNGTTNGAADPQEDIARASFTIQPSFSTDTVINDANTPVSEAAWGDYDNDGDLDLLVVRGRSFYGNADTYILENNGDGTFTNQTDVGLPALFGDGGRAAWGDYDGDGWLDLVMAGDTSLFSFNFAPATTLYRNNRDGTFTADTASSLVPVVYGDVSWVDYDNDNDLDLLVFGANRDFQDGVAMLYSNAGGVLSDSGITFPQIRSGMGVWGDYDNDGFPDLYFSTVTSLGLAAIFLHNNGGSSFTEVDGVPAIVPSSLFGTYGVSNHTAAQWGDYDADGDLDLLIAGTDGTSQQVRIYRNDAGAFTFLTTSISGLAGQTVAWGDYDNDGDLDIATGGIDPNTSTNPAGRVYINTGSTYSVLPGYTLGHGPVAWGDFDSDGDLDLVTGDVLYINNRGANAGGINDQPDAPSDLTATIDSPTSVILSWTAPTGDATPPAGLTYNLRVGTTPGGSDVLAAQALPNGTLTIPRAGQMSTTSWRLAGLTTGTRYYWSVQAVDTGFEGSSFATEGTFLPTTPPTPSNGSVTALEDTDYVFKSSDFPFSDTDAGDTIQFVKIVTLPAKGTLALNGTPVAVGQAIAIADVTADKFTYRADTNEHGSTYTSFTFRVGDFGALSASAATMSVSVTAVTDAPIVNATLATGSEETAIPLAISVQLADTDGSEALGSTVTIRGVPTRATLSAGTTSGGGVWTLTIAQLVGLTITPPANSDADFTLTVEATATETSTSISATGSGGLQVFVTSVADTPSLTVSSASGSEGTAIALTITAGLSDNDTSEGLQIVLTCVPTGATLTAGTQGPVGTWTLTPSQLSGLTITFPDDGTYNLTVTAVATESENGDTESTSETLTVSVSNVAPMPSLSAAPVIAVEGSPITMTGSATDPSSVDTTTLALTWTVTKNSVAFASGTGSVIAFTPDDNGTYQVTLTATDKDSGTNQTSVSFAVTNVAPTISSVSNNGPVSEGSTVTVSVIASDSATGDALTVEYDFDGDNVYETSNPTHLFDNDGNYTVGVRVSDGDGGFAYGSTTVDVTNVAPTGSFTDNGPLVEGDTATVSFSGVSDPSLADTSAGFRYSFALDTGSLADTYAVAQVASSAGFVLANDGDYMILGRVFDVDGSYSDYATLVTVSNATPVVSAPGNQTTDEGASKLFLLGSFTDEGISDGPWSVVVSWGDGSSDATFSAASLGNLGSLAHSYADNGTYTVTITVTDTDGGSGSNTLNVSVANQPPVPNISGVPANPVEGTAITLRGSATDPGTLDTVTLVWSVTKDSSPFTSGSGASFSFTPDDNATYVVTLTATDSDGISASTYATLTISNLAPTITTVTTAGPVNEGDAVTVTVSATDLAGANDSLTYEFDFDGDGTYEVSNNTGVATHAFATSGNHTVKVRVTDGDGGVTTDTIIVAVNNVAPVLGGVPSGSITVAEETSTTFTATGSDIASDVLTFTLVGAPVGATLDPTTGVFTWTPTELQGPASYTFTVAVSDGTDTTQTPVTIVVSEVNRPPVLAALPTNLNVTVRFPITFQVTATDRDLPGNTLTYSLLDAPTGMVINPATGLVTWTPGSAQVGTVTLRVRVMDVDGAFDEKPIMIRVDPASPDQNQASQFAIAGGETVTTYDSTGHPVRSNVPFPGSLVQVAIADVTGDQVPDEIVVSGPGTRTRLAIYDGMTGELVWSSSVFEDSFLSGAFVAAGDVDGDGKADIAVAAAEKGGPRVVLFSGADGSVIADFYGIDDENFRGGTRVALGDVNGDGLADLVVAAGIGGGPRVALFDGASLRSRLRPVRLVNDFFVFEPTLRDGIYVTAGDVNGDGFADLVFGGGPGGGPRVMIWDSLPFLRSGGADIDLLANFYASKSSLAEGVRVTAKDLDGDEFSDLVVGVPTDTGSKAMAYLGKNITPSGTPLVFAEFDTAIDGVFVG